MDGNKGRSDCFFVSFHYLEYLLLGIRSKCSIDFPAYLIAFICKEENIGHLDISVLRIAFPVQLYIH